MKDWAYLVSGYYADNVKPPKRPGEHALTVGCDNAGVAALEVSVFRGRSDIGDVVCVPPLPQETPR